MLILHAPFMVHLELQVEIRCLLVLLSFTWFNITSEHSKISKSHGNSECLDNHNFLFYKLGKVEVQ